MLVVADTSPINYLILIQHELLLPTMYTQVLVSPAVLRELEDPETPEAVRTWMTHPPTWFERRAPQQPPAETAFPALGAGEREAIVVAKGVQADFVLIDERDGRRVARSLTLAVIGTLGVLEEAAVRGLLDLPRALARLQANHLLCITSLV
jgi:predicted nucleic acid-binding protein